jgi:hypothetical protein
MDIEEIVLNWLSEQDSKNYGIFAGIIASLVYAYKKISFFEKIASAFWTERTFEKYNQSLFLIYEKRTTYKFFSAQFRRDSYELFDCLKIVYDLESATSIRSKTLNFRLEEITESSSLFTNITRFLDYYKSRNGVRINIFLHSTTLNGTTTSNIKESVQKYILDSKIHAVKVISGNYKE